MTPHFFFLASYFLHITKITELGLGFCLQKRGWRFAFTRGLICFAFLFVLCVLVFGFLGIY